MCSISRPGLLKICHPVFHVLSPLQLVGNRGNPQGNFYKLVLKVAKPQNRRCLSSWIVAWRHPSWLQLSILDCLVSKNNNNKKPFCCDKPLKCEVLSVITASITLGSIIRNSRGRDVLSITPCDAMWKGVDTSNSCWSRASQIWEEFFEWSNDSFPFHDTKFLYGNIWTHCSLTHWHIPMWNWILPSVS